MKELTKIIPEPVVDYEASKKRLDDLVNLKSQKFRLNLESELINLLVHKINDLTEELNRIRNYGICIQT